MKRWELSRGRGQGPGAVHSAARGDPEKKVGRRIVEEDDASEPVNGPAGPPGNPAVLILAPSGVRSSRFSVLGSDGHASK